MQSVTLVPTLVGQIYDRILSEICDGTLPANTRLIQDELAEAYDVSRQPVQQALALLRDRGFVINAPKRGVVVAELDIDFVRSAYEIREVLDGLACRLAAERSPREAGAGREILERGRAAVASGAVAEQIAEDIAFHQFVNALSRNRAIEEAARPYWHHMRRIMGEVLRVDRGVDARVWDEHAAILDAIIGNDPEAAERLGREHIRRASIKFVSKLEALRRGADEESRKRSLARRLR
ncbi:MULTISPECIES: GntR family transcriptional regulator [Methylorubrum]|uniref:GntR family transcriptional regulator n=1 Tax=Methylorubrum TaxID=2282523 RepID=UPI00209D5D02|nr:MULTISPECIES: GntR family transcriptional regulator [Methylorubrum]MCP1550313.1 DNA-binding GntR family transcriptional regulator [Methylorubrum zatmanii]MCP1580616.1 DNA-binding GntR family transcriptional regulator [Methylorubrum extorquens]